MTNCPKCAETDLKWVPTKNNKHWLKRDLGEGQTGKDWHECNENLIKTNNYKLKPYCHDCIVKLIHCTNPDCMLCSFKDSLCTKCMTHPNVVDMR